MTHTEPLRPAAPGRTEDVQHMREAIALAEKGWGRVSPNPMVGAVVAVGDEVVGRGYHSEFGKAHAETVALEDAADRARGGTLYVNLEPCAHTGHTPPCTEAIRRAGIRRVVIACRDPNPKAAGGAEALRAGGIDVELGVESRAAQRLNAPFLWYHTVGRPFVSLKLAMSLDGRLGAAGTRSTVSGPAAWARVHKLRAGHDAILVGRLTAVIDDPLLTPRGEEYEARRRPTRIVLDSALRLAPSSQLARTTDLAPVLLFADEASEQVAERRAELEAQGVEIASVPGAGSGDGLDLERVLAELGRRGVTSLLVEGGGHTATSFMRGGFVQQMHLIYAPLLFGDAGVPAFPGLDPVPSGEWNPIERDTLGLDHYLRLEHADVPRTLAV